MLSGKTEGKEENPPSVLLKINTEHFFFLIIFLVLGAVNNLYLKQSNRHLFIYIILFTNQRNVRFTHKSNQ